MIKTNKGYNIRLKKKKEHNSNSSLCYSCKRGGTGSMYGRKYECDNGCDGFFIASTKDKFVVKCDGYEEQTFKMTEKREQELRNFIESFCSESIDGQDNISQQSDSFLGMMESLVQGIKYLLTHRYYFNDLQDKTNPTQKGKTKSK